MTRDEALRKAISDILGFDGFDSVWIDEIFASLSASGFAIVAVGGPMRLEFSSPHGLTTIELDANAWAHVVAAAQEDSHE